MTPMGFVQFKQWLACAAHRVERNGIRVLRSGPGKLDLYWKGI